MTDQVLAEVFGFPAENRSEEAQRYRNLRLCPFNNRVPSCTKDKANDPLGVCSIYEKGKATITCPVRFREDWLIVEDSAHFFFPKGARWTTLGEVRLTDAHGKSAGNIDMVLVSYDERGRILDFGALEVQAVYISGNIRHIFEHYLESPGTPYPPTEIGGLLRPRADYLSSSRKRLAPQLLFKGGILNAWRKKQAVALQRQFFESLPPLPRADPTDAEIAWLIYDLVRDSDTNQLKLTRMDVAYTHFAPALMTITTPEIGALDLFLAQLQGKLDQKT